MPPAGAVCRYLRHRLPNNVETNIYPSWLWRVRGHKYYCIFSIHFDCHRFIHHRNTFGVQVSSVYVCHVVKEIEQILSQTAHGVTMFVFVYGYSGAAATPPIAACYTRAHCRCVSIVSINRYRTEWTVYTISIALLGIFCYATKAPTHTQPHKRCNECDTNAKIYAHTQTETWCFVCYWNEARMVVGQNV